MNSSLVNDTRVINGLFASLRTSIPHDTLIRLLSESGDEIKFLIVVQPRVSSFSSRRRHSLRHPALSMATKRFFSAQSSVFGNDSADVVAEGNKRWRNELLAFEENIWNEFLMTVSSSLNQLLNTAYLSEDTSPLQRRGSSPYSQLSLAHGSNGLVNLVESHEGKNGSRQAKKKELEKVKKRKRQKKQEEKLNADKLNLEKMFADVEVDGWEEEIQKLQVQEDYCWEQISACYDLLLKRATVPCHVAAYAAAVDGPLNDIIRRFWDRITVTPSDKMHASKEGRGVENHEVESEQPTVSPAKKAKKKGKKKKKGNKKNEAVFMTELRTPSKSRKRFASTALYMAPHQYIYLNTQIANILLPSRKEIKLEMLQSVQEDLIHDALFSETDSHQELYFGKAPFFLVPDGLMVDKNPNHGKMELLKNEVAKQISRFSDSVHSGIPHALAQREAYAELENVYWNASNLPYITYGQFWHSMMALADNWTCSAANPVEYALFLLELYGEVFQKDWNALDESFYRQLEEALEEQGETEEELNERLQQTEYVLNGFNQMIEEMKDWDSETDSINDEWILGNRFVCDEPEKKEKMTLDDLNKMMNAEGAYASDWEYSDRVDENGITRHYRRKEIHVRSRKLLGRRKKSKASYSDDDSEGDEEDSAFGSLSDESEYSIYILDEELDASGKVIKRKRYHKHRTMDGNARSDFSASDGDAFMYIPVECGLGDTKNVFLERHMFDKPPKKRRRLEGASAPWSDDYDMNENVSDDESWSSFSAGDGDRGLFSLGNYDEDTWQKRFYPLEGNLAGRKGRRRHRVRRVGKRKGMRRYGRDPSFYYEEKHEEEYSFSSETLSLEEDIDEDETDQQKEGKKSSSEEDEGPLPLVLDDKQREYLRNRKSFLQQMLAAKGIKISDAAFEDESEEATLWQLLKMAEAHKKKVDAGEATEDDFGIANFDPALLAKIFSNPDTFSLDDLQRSELMRLLLDDEDGQRASRLTAAQMLAVLSALQAKPKNRLELPSERLRRERLIAKMKEMEKAQKKLEKERERAEREAGREKRLNELRALKDALKKENVFELTEGPPPEERKRMPSFDSEQSAISDEPLFGGFGIKIFKPSPKKISQKVHELSSSGSFGVDALTIEKRRRQEQLYKEFEKYMAEQASLGGRYRVALTSYTVEQIEEFAGRLHLGRKDTALLKGRAPLAEPASLIGGTKHQLSRLSAAVGKRGEGLREELEPRRPQPKISEMKLYTLTTESSLKKALWDTYRQYVDDKEYITSFLGTKKNVPKPPQSFSNAPKLPPPSLKAPSLLSSRIPRKKKPSSSGLPYLSETNRFHSFRSQRTHGASNDSSNIPIFSTYASSDSSSSSSASHRSLSKTKGINE